MAIVWSSKLGKSCKSWADNVWRNVFGDIHHEDKPEGGSNNAALWETLFDEFSARCGSRPR